MPRIKFEFTNESNQTLAGLLETPDTTNKFDQCAIFAHCFTCGKDIAAASHIARKLAANGIAVLRFDFTGLGNSDGDFSNSNFSSNIEDLLAAANALTKHYIAPTLLIGHSLGGAAVLSAAKQIPSIKAISTIASPATANHVKHLFCSAESTIERKGIAKVAIGPREFTIKQQLLQDLEQYASDKHIAALGIPLLVFHSPLDSIVPISEAAKIYQAAKHPKSFISLDNADHLLTKKEDSQYVATTLAAWASRYLNNHQEEVTKRQIPTSTKLAEGTTRVTEKDQKILRGLYTNSHQLLADEPLSYGGSNLGPSPYDLFLMSLGACTSMTLRMYANRKKWPLDDIVIDLQHEKVHAVDCEDCQQQDGKIDRIHRSITLLGKLSETQKQRLLEIADRCPVHRTMENNPIISTALA